MYKNAIILLLYGLNFEIPQFQSNTKNQTALSLQPMGDGIESYKLSVVLFVYLEKRGLLRNLSNVAGVSQMR